MTNPSQAHLSCLEIKGSVFAKVVEIQPQAQTTHSESCLESGARTECSHAGGEWGPWPTASLLSQLRDMLVTSLKVELS